MQSTLPLRSLPLAITHVSKLSAAGFEAVGDLRDVGIIDLSKGEPCKNVWSLSNNFHVYFYTFNLLIQRLVCPILRRWRC